MSILSRSNMIRAAVAAAALAPICLVLAVQTNSYSANARLQDLADAAALAGVSSLASSVGHPDGERRAASIAVAKGVIATRPNVTSEVAPSPDDAKVSVVVRDTALGKQTSAVAGYIAPSAGAPTRQSSYMLLPSPGTM